jgi:lycopene cyclase domain-containing protein
MKYTYFISNFIPVVLALLIIWRNNKKLFRRVLPVLIILGVLGLINALAENPALRWGVWIYNSSKTTGITFFKVLLETYIYCILVPVAIGSAAIKFAERQDAERKK